MLTEIPPNSLDFTLLKKLQIVSYKRLENISEAIQLRSDSSFEIKARLKSFIREIFHEPDILPPEIEKCAGSLTNFSTLG